MPVPSPRNKLLPARGEYLTLDQALPSLFEGEFVWANDTNKYYQVTDGILKPVTVNPSELALVIQSVSDVDAKADQNTSDIALNSQNIVSEAQLRVFNDTALQGQIDSLGTDASALTGRVGQNEAAITNIEANIDSVEETLDVKADLVDGLVPTSQLPGIAISEFLGEVADEVAMLALTGEQGDWCIRSDVSDTYVITGDDPSLLVNWTELATPASPVTSVNDQVGAVVLGAADVGAIPATDAPNFAPNTVDLQGVTNNGNTTTTGASFGNTVQSPSFFGNATGTAQIWYGGATGTSVITADGTGTFSGDLRVQDGGNFRIRNADNATQDAILLQNNGNASFTGSVQAGGSPLNGGAQGSALGSYGGVNAARTTGSNSVFNGFTVGTSTPTSSILANGTASFASGSFVIDGSGSIQTNINSAGHIKLDSSGDFSDPSIWLNSITGSASFANRVDTKGGVTVDGGASLSTGLYYRDDSEENGLALYSGGSNKNNRRAFIKTDGSATFKGTISASGQNTINEASTLKLSQETNVKSQIRAYGPDASTTGSLEFKVSPTSGTALTPLTLNSDGNVTVSGSVDLTDSTIDLYSQTTNSTSKTVQIFSDIGGAKTEKAFVTADGSASFEGNVGVGDTSPDARCVVYRATQFAGNTVFAVKSDANGSKSTILKVDGDGSTEFAGRLKVTNANPYSPNNIWLGLGAHGTPSKNYDFVTIDSGGDVVAGIMQDGNASFLNSSDGAYTFISHKPAATAFSISGGSTNNASAPEWYITPSGNIKCNGRITADSGLDVSTGQSYWLRLWKNGTPNMIGFSSGTLMIGGTLDPTFATTQKPKIYLDADNGSVELGQSGEEQMVRFRPGSSGNADAIWLQNTNNDRPFLVTAAGLAKFNSTIECNVAKLAEPGIKATGNYQGANYASVVARQYTSGGYNFVGRNAAGTTTFSVNEGGSSTFIGTVTAQGSVLTSDARFKTDITDASSQLDDVVALGNSLRNWSWTEEAPVADKETRFLGLIAQEAEEICPGIVTTIERTDDSYKAIKNDVLVMKLLGAVAELKAEVEDLKQKLAEA